jgi:hypothetical protein
MEQYEEYKDEKQTWIWTAVIIFSVLLLSWGMLLHMIIPDAPRSWDFDVLPDAPGQSKYSTVPSVHEANVPVQLELPEKFLQNRSKQK